MEAKLIYSKSQFDMAVKFIARNNSYFLGQTDLIRTRLIDSIMSLAKSRSGSWTQTMGFTILSYREDEGIESDESYVRIEIFVDPALGLDHTEDDYHSEVIETDWYTFNNVVILKVWQQKSVQFAK